MEIEKPALLDVLETSAPLLSTTTDVPVVPKPEPLPEAKIEVKTEAEPEKAEQSEESATSATEKPGQQTEPPRGVGKALAELRQQKREAEARAKQAEDNLKAALELKAKVVVEEDSGPVKPSKESFTDPDAYDAALLAYADEKAAHTARKQVNEMLKEQEAKTAQERVEEGLRLTREAYNTRLETAKTKYADFEEVAQSPDVQISMPMVHAIMTTEQGPDIQYYLGKNPNEAARITAYVIQTREGPVPDVARQLMELGLIAAKLNAPKPTVSTASPPIRPLKTGAVVTPKTPDEESMEEYAARRKKELSAQMRH